jgi:hypothetical protein
LQSHPQEFLPVFAGSPFEKPWRLHLTTRVEFARTLTETALCLILLSRARVCIHYGAKPCQTRLFELRGGAGHPGFVNNIVNNFPHVYFVITESFYTFVSLNYTDMETLKEIVSKHFTQKMSEWYRPRAVGGTLYICAPGFINIERDDAFTVEESDVAVRFFTSKVIVTLFKNVYLENITVL